MSMRSLHMPSCASTKDMATMSLERLSRAVLRATLSADFVVRDSTGMMSYMLTAVTATNDATFAIDALQPANTSIISTTMPLKAISRQTTFFAWTKSALKRSSWSLSLKWTSKLIN